MIRGVVRSSPMILGELKGALERFPLRLEQFYGSRQLCEHRKVFSKPSQCYHLIHGSELAVQAPWLFFSSFLCNLCPP